MALSPVPRRSSQLPLFARPLCNPHWTDLSSDVQRKIMRWVAELLREHRKMTATPGIAEEEHGE
jgi:hypothetical protein